MSERFVRRTGYVPARGRQEAARHLLRESRLGLHLDDFWDPACGGPDWAGMMAGHGRDATDAVLIALAESLWAGALGAVGRLGGGDREALLQALDIVSTDVRQNR